MARRVLAGATLAVLAAACGEEPDQCGPQPTRGDVTNVSWVKADWGTTSINAFWVGAQETTTFIRAVRDDGSLAGLNHPGHFNSVPVTSDRLVGLWGSSTSNQLTAMTPEGKTHVSTGGGDWEEGASIPTSFVMRALTGSETGELWAVGSGALIAHFDGTEWSSQRYGAANLDGVWASGDAVWAVGDEGVLRRADDDTFEDAGLAATGLHGVFGLPTGEVFVVGDGGAWFEWDGTAWSAIVTPTESALRSVWADPELGAWAGGDDGALLYLRPGSTEAVAEKPPSPDFALHITSIYGTRAHRVVDTEELAFAVWAGTAEGSALSKEDLFTMFCN